MRERLWILLLLVALPRITPAYAGKTADATDYEIRSKDHPRVCGKDSKPVRKLPDFLGSPPRMRERRLMYAAGGTVHRITPAYAGKTSQNPSLYGLVRDHPRVCGKDYSSAGNAQRERGSPPRMRERLTFQATQNNPIRITPAYAGKTNSALTEQPSLRDHPRVCGKDFLLQALTQLLGGSPPRMRERHSEPLHSHHLYRITPAYAGKTFYEIN